MPERDPFGRLPDENPLAGLGSLSEGSESQTAEPVVSSWGASEEAAPDAAAPEPVPSQPPGRRDRLQQAARRRTTTAASAAEYLDPAQFAQFAQIARRMARVVRAVFVIAFVFVIVGVVLSLLVSGDSDTGTPGGVPPSGPSQQSRPAGGEARAPRGLQRRSLLARRNLAPALRRLRTSGLGRLRSLRIAPERIDAQLLTRGGSLRSVQLRFDGELRRLSVGSGGFGGLPTIAFSDVDPAAPSRLARGAARRSGRSLNQVDYVVRINAGTLGGWTVVMRGGGQFLGDDRGTITRRIG